MEIRLDTEIVKDFQEACNQADITGLTLTLYENPYLFIIKQKGERVELLVTHDIREIRGFIKGWQASTV